jgi:hypothetical protein
MRALRKTDPSNYYIAAGDMRSGATTPSALVAVFIHASDRFVINCLGARR